MLKLIDLVSGYTGVNIIRGVSMEVAKKEIVTIVGPNGSGKSTLMKTIFGLSPKLRDILFNKLVDINELGTALIYVSGAKCKAGVSRESQGLHPGDGEKFLC